LREQLDEAATGADLLVGGPPCQAFSQVRNHSRLIEDPRNSLYREFVSAVATARPAAFLMENVPGMAQMGVKAQVLEDLQLDGEYRVDAQLVNAADFGVPQTRKRLLFLGVRADLNAPPPQLAGSGATASIQLVRFGSDTDAFGARTDPGYAVAARPDELGETIGIRLADPGDAGVVSVAQAISDLSGLQAPPTSSGCAKDRSLRR
jgi:DNA (cytosine-5)-methyltransferase 1